MGQEIRGVSEAAALTDSSDEPGIGLYLARQRTLRGISVEDLAARTKIPRRSLERLEAGAFDRAADGFSRGFVRTVALALGLDADDAVARLLTEPPDDEREVGYASLRHHLLLGAAAALAVGFLGLAVWGVRSIWFSEEPGDPQTSVFYRRDAVRALADDMATGEPDPVDERPLGALAAKSAN